MSQTQQSIDILNGLNEKEQEIAHSFLTQMSELHEEGRKFRNEAYEAKIRRGIKQCAEGRGIERDIIEADEDE